MIDSLADHPDCIKPLAERLKDAFLDPYLFLTIINNPLGSYDKASKIINSASDKIKRDPSLFNTFVAKLKEVGLNLDAKTLEENMSECFSWILHGIA